MSLETTFSPLRQDGRPLRAMVIATSLAEESDQVVRAGLAATRAAGARAHLVHAVEPEAVRVSVEEGVGPVDERMLIALSKEELQRQLERLGIVKSELAGAHVLAGAPHRVITAVAQQAGADLIVIGATGAGPWAAELLGSTADRVLRQASCPVLVVRGELRVPPRHVLAPVDLSTLSGDAFHCGLHLLAQLGAGEETQVRAVYALSLLDALEARRRGGRASLAAIEGEAAAKLQRFVLENRPLTAVHLTTHVLPGEARREILRALTEGEADLVIVGSHGRGGLDRLLLGSVASSVARKAPCSVLVVPPEAAFAEGLAVVVASATEPHFHAEPAAVA